MSKALARSLHLNLNFNNFNNLNKGGEGLELELEHWYELCHPEDNNNLVNFTSLIFSGAQTVTLNRRLYCGDGVYRRFCLDAVIEHDEITGAPLFLTGIETFLKPSRRADELKIPALTAVQALKLIELIAHKNRKFKNFVENIKNIKDALLNISDNIYNNNYNQQDGNFLKIAVTGLEGSGRTSFVNAFNNYFSKRIKIKLVEINIDIKNIKIENLNASLEDCGMILYLIPVRTRPSYDDMRFLDACSATGLKINILMTQIDIERDETQAGKIINKKAEILRENLVALNNELKLQITPVSAKYFEINKTFIKYIEMLNANAQAYKKSIRGFKIIKLLERALEILNTEFETEKISDKFLNLLSLRSESDDANAFEAAHTAINESIDALHNALLDMESIPDINNNLNNIKNIKIRDGELYPEFNFNFNNKNYIETGESGSALTSLLRSMREETLRTRFLAMPFTNRRVILLSANRRDSVKLISRLAHNAALLDIEIKTPKNEWFYSGRNVPSTFSGTLLPAISGDIEILAAPSDAFINQNAKINWNILFAQWTPVIHVDLNRIKAGLADVERAPYFKALSGVSRFVIAYANGGFFDDRLHDLITKIPEQVKIFMANHKFRSSLDWFIYENYNSGYTDFINMGTQLSRDSDDDDIAALISLWEECGAGFEPPFTRDNLISALKAAAVLIRGGS